MARYGKWYIGPTLSDETRGVEVNSLDVCIEETANDDWFEWDDSQWIQVESIQVRCVDHIDCSCQNIDISGFKRQSTRNGLFVAGNNTIHGRKC